MHASAPGMGLLLPLCLSAGTVVLAETAPRPAPAAEVVELEVLGVVPLESEAASLLVLRQKGEAVVLPVFVGRAEGAAVERELGRAPSPRPPASSLLQGVIAALGGRVTRVELQGARAALLRARVTLQQGGRRLEVEARPSDSVTLAMAAHAPIFATREVMAEAGLGRRELEQLRRRREIQAAEEAAGAALRF